MKSTLIAPLLTLFITQVSSTNDDIIACAFNKIRARQGLPSLKINKHLTESAQTQSNYMFKINKMTLRGPGNLKISQRVDDQGYNSTYAMGMVGKGYKDAESFANDMISRNPEKINNENITHLGVGNKEEFWTIDLASSDEKVTSRQATC